LGVGLGEDHLALVGGDPGSLQRGRLSAVGRVRRTLRGYRRLLRLSAGGGGVYLRLLADTDSLGEGQGLATDLEGCAGRLGSPRERANLAAQISDLAGQSLRGVGRGQEVNLRS